MKSLSERDIKELCGDESDRSTSKREQSLSKIDEVLWAKAVQKRTSSRQGSKFVQSFQSKFQFSSLKIEKHRARPIAFCISRLGEPMSGFSNNFLPSTN